MNTDPKLYDKSNKLQKKDAEVILKRFQKEYENNPPSLIVDIGCGTGNITQRLWCSFPNTRTIGLDCSEEMIEFARDYYSAHNLDFCCADICSDLQQLAKILQIKPGSVDVVTSSYCLHWVADAAKAMENINKMLKVGGRCYLIMFSWSSLLPLQEQITHREPWCELFRKLEITGENEKPTFRTTDDGSNAKSAHESSQSKSAARKQATRRKSSAPFPVYEVPPERERIEHWVRLCKNSGLKPINVDIHDSKFTYQDLDGFKGELQSLCHFLHHLPKDRHNAFLDDYYTHMYNCFISKQNSLPKINVDYQFLTVIAEKTVESSNVVEDTEMK